MKTILEFARIDPARPIKQVCYTGFPQAISPDGSAPKPMSRAAVIYVELDGSSVMLYRIVGAGRVFADTWHQNLDDAKAQAVYEFGEGLEWEKVPERMTDPFAYLLSLCTGS